MSPMPDEPPMLESYPVDDVQLRALIPLPSDPALPVPVASSLPAALADAETRLEAICIIPGSGVPEVPALAPVRRRPVRLHVLISLLGLCGLLAALLSFAPLTEAAGT